MTNLTHAVISRDASGMPPVATLESEVRPCVAEARRLGKSIGVVPTMGALHAGHLSLVEACCRECEFTAVTVFVNPTQFGPGEDFARYPRSLPKDLELLRQYPVDLVFAPATNAMYAPGHATFVDVGDVTSRLEGSHRPGHFRGVATIVLKLLNIVTPDRAYFGQKDYQQTLVVRRLVRDLDLPIEIRVCPTVREPDGLAKSSRNAYLSPRQRRQALVLFRSLNRAAEMVRSGERSAAAVLQEMRRIFSSEPEVRPDYVTLADPETLEELSVLDRPVVAAVAAVVGSTRLIDNLLLGPSRETASG